MSSLTLLVLLAALFAALLAALFAVRPLDPSTIVK
jgi:hypothetical protein